tara:strand:- start:694 stop:2238 length:1545 start_codon:yes stop_codon:yes gene_type:complete
MADKVVLEAEIKSNIKTVSKETKDLTNEFGAFGITIGGIKDKFKDMGKIMMNGLKQVALQAKLAGVGFKKMFSGQIIGGAKTLFTVIKTGIAATGIGLLVVAFGSLVAHVTNTKKGAEALEKTFQTLGAAVSVITDRVAKFGGAVIKFFKGDFKGAAEDAKASVTGIVSEIKEEVKATVKMVDVNQKLRDAQRALNVETAQSVADIEKLKLLAEDITKSYAEREAAATQAFAKETELENKRIALAEQAVALEVERHRMMGVDGVMAQDLDALAELEINLANVRQESAGRQISLQNFLNGLREQEKAEIQAAADKKIADDEAEAKRLEDIAKKKAEDDEKARQKELDEAKRVADEKVRIEEEAAKEKLRIEKELENAKLKTIDMGFGAAEALVEESDAASKAVAVAKTIYNTQQAIMNAMANVPAPFNIAQSIATGVMGALAVKKILSTSPSGGASAGGGASAAASGGTPAPQMMSGAFDLTGGVEPEPTRAYVLTDEMTNSQNQLANIRRRATI